MLLIIFFYYLFSSFITYLLFYNLLFTFYYLLFIYYFNFIILIYYFNLLFIFYLYYLFLYDPGKQFSSFDHSIDQRTQINKSLIVLFSVRCPMMRLNNGKIRVRARGRIVRFNCLDGFTLVGNKYSTCVRGQWDTPTPVCVSK